MEWPGKEQHAAQPKGYVYIIFETEKQVKLLLQACSIQDTFISNDHSSTGSIPSSCSSMSSNNGNYYYKISSKRIKAKEVEVIPWIIGDSNYVKSTSPKLDPTKTVSSYIALLGEYFIYMYLFMYKIISGLVQLLELF